MTTSDGRPASDDRGRDAEQPTQMPPRGWKDVLWCVKEESKRDHVMLLSAGVAFFGLLALVPALGGAPVDLWPGCRS